MTDNEIIKALECVQKETCFNCHHTVAKEALDLINRQKAEIERLQGMGLHEVLTERAWRIIQDLRAENERLADRSHKCIYLSDEETTEYCVDGPCPKFKTEQQIRAEAIKEFAERVKKEFADFVVNVSEMGEIVDNLVKEMTEEKNDE